MLLHTKNWVNFAGAVVAVEISCDGSPVRSMWNKQWVADVAAKKEKGVLSLQEFSRPNSDPDSADILAQQLQEEFGLEEMDDPQSFAEMTKGLKSRPDITSRFQQGQVWRYITRPGEENSFAFVGHVADGNVHFALVGIKMKVKDPRGRIDSKPLLAPLIGHVCLVEKSFADSVTDLIDNEHDYQQCVSVMKGVKLSSASQLGDLFVQGYQAFKEGEGTPSETTIAQMVENIEQAMNSGNSQARLMDEDERPGQRL